MIEIILLACALNVPTGTHHVMMTAYYQHQDPSRVTRPYTSTASAYVIGPRYLDVFTGHDCVEGEPCAPGYPAAIEWWIDGVAIQSCGEIPWPTTPDRIFRDGFEVGETSRWSAQSQSIITVTYDGHLSMNTTNESSNGRENLKLLLGRLLMKTARQHRDLQKKHLTMNGWEDVENVR